MMGRLVTGLITSVLLFSIGLNIYLGMWFVAVMSGPTESTYLSGDDRYRIVILPIKGMIDSDTASFVHDALKSLRKNKPLAIVLRVDSGGGGVAASDRIWHDLVSYMEESQVPVVASFGTVAASGGYYVAAPSDYIIAEPSTITGSIGVIAHMFTVQELLKKIGVTPEIIVATHAVRKDMLSPMRDWTEEDRRALRVILDSSYDRFIDIVAKGRENLSPEQVKRLATGEIYTSQQALENRLIDGHGYLGTAIDKACELAGISEDIEPLVTMMSPPRSLSLLGGLSAPVGLKSITSQGVRRWIGELGAPRIEYRWVR